MISFHESVEEDEKNKILEILPSWKTFIFEVRRREMEAAKKLEEIKFIVAIKNKDEFRKWLLEFESCTKTGYTVRSTEPAGGKFILFKQRLVCLHNTRCERIHNPTASAHKVTKNTNCPSRMVVTIHVVKSRYRGKFKWKADLSPEMPCEISLTLDHNHNIGSGVSLRYRKPSREVTDKLISLFRKGHSPATALQTIKIEIQLNHSGDSLALSDRFQCPDYGYCYHLYRSVFKKVYSPMDFNHDAKELLQQQVREYNANMGSMCAKMIVNENNYIICICSPLAKRVHKHLKDSSQMALLDSTGYLDQTGSRLFVILTHSDCGGLPLGTLITSSDSSDVLEIGFQLLKEIVGESIFGGHINGPNIFLTYDSLSEQSAIYSSFAACDVLLCTLHVLQDVWRWLSKCKNNIPQEEQCTFFHDFKNIMFAQTEDEAIRNYYLARSHGIENFTNFSDYLDNYWERRNLWVLAYRSDLLEQGYSTNNFFEALMKIIKDKIFEKVKSFNVVQMLDFIATKFDSYFERKLLDAASNRHAYSVFHRPAKLPNEDTLNRIKKISENIFLVPSESQNNRSYVVNLDVLICTCLGGNMGKVCKHIEWASVVSPSDKYMKPLDSDMLRRLYYLIAKNEEPPAGWLESLPGTDSDVSAVFKEAQNVRTPIITVLEPEVNVSEMPLISDCSREGIDKILPKINAICTNFAKKSPEEVTNGLQKMYEKMRKIKTPSAFASHCSNFGEVPMEENCVYNIPVQPTIVSVRQADNPVYRILIAGRQRSSLFKRKYRKIACKLASTTQSHVINLN